MKVRCHTKYKSSRNVWIGSLYQSIMTRYYVWRGISKDIEYRSYSNSQGTWTSRMNHGSSIKNILGDYNDVIMSAMASQTTGVSFVYSSVCSGVDQRKRQSSTPLAFVRGIHRGQVVSPHKGPVTRKNDSIWWRHHGDGRAIRRLYYITFIDYKSVSVKNPQDVL